MKTLKILALLLLFNVLVFAQELEIITCECPPFSYKEGEEVKGPAVEIFRGIQKKLSTDEKLSVYPWARGYIMLIEEPNVVLFLTTKTQHRKDKFKWMGPIAKREYNFYAKKGSQINIKNFEEAKQYRIGVVIGSNNEQYLVSKGFKNLDSVTNENENLGNLVLERIDLWYTDSAQASSLGKKFSRKSLIESRFNVKTDKSYFAFNKDISDTVLKSWQDSFDEMREEGQVLEIFQKHKLEAMYPMYNHTQKETK